MSCLVVSGGDVGPGYFQGYPRKYVRPLELPLMMTRRWNILTHRHTECVCDPGTIIDARFMLDCNYIEIGIEMKAVKLFLFVLVMSVHGLEPKLSEERVVFQLQQGDIGMFSP